MRQFFTIDHHKSILAEARSKISLMKAKDEFEEKRNIHCRFILTSMNKESEQWDSRCQLNIEWIGTNLTGSAQEINGLDDEQLSKEHLDNFASSLCRFLMEFYASSGGEFSFEFNAAKSFFFDNLEKFEYEAREQIKFAQVSMPLEMFRRVTNSEAIGSIKEFNGSVGKINALTKQLDGEIIKKTEAVNQLKNSLDKYKTAFNFVGLHQGFDELATAKKGELVVTLMALWGIGLLTFAPATFELGYLIKNADEVNTSSNIFWMSLFPVISITALLIYYFRVLLFNFKSLKSQLIQIELRKTLCRFIQSYSDYAKELKSKDNESLAKFENVIFAGIVSGDEKLPSTYDGLDQIGALIKSLKT
ncbi:hypothetical protein ACNKU7_08745 [Microbulbifer sp. SA54]|uniref:hypothetical protein n=1 Tax=Microbulbifer sp. SA54 TaxID=3401577 RepID=UPI003AAEDA84